MLYTTHMGPTVKRGMDCGMESFRGIIKKVVASCRANNHGCGFLYGMLQKVCAYHVSQQKSTDVKYTSLTRQQWDA